MYTALYFLESVFNNKVKGIMFLEILLVNLDTLPLEQCHAILFDHYFLNHTFCREGHAPSLRYDLLNGCIGKMHTNI